MAVYDAAAVGDIPEGAFKIVEVAGRSIGLYNVKGQFYAVHNYCPHQGAKLCRGPVCGTTLESRVYEYRYGKEGEIVRCPWHGWEFDIRTGKSLFDPRVRTRCYPVCVEDGRIGIVIGESGERKAE